MPDTTREFPPDEVERRLDDTLVMLDTHKRRHAALLAAGDEDAAVSTLATITRLELQLANIEQFVRARRLTVRR